MNLRTDLRCSNTSAAKRRTYASTICLIATKIENSRGAVVNASVHPHDGGLEVTNQRLGNRRLSVVSRRNGISMTYMFIHHFASSDSRLSAK